MNRRAMIILAVVAGVIAAALGFVWNQFLYTDICLDRGGQIVQSLCVDPIYPSCHRQQLACSSLPSAVRSCA
jgi:hypothetical protein